MGDIKNKKEIQTEEREREREEKRVKGNEYERKKEIMRIKRLGRIKDRLILKL